MLQEDSALAGIGCVIFDEFHERSLNADLGLALVHREPAEPARGSAPAGDVGDARSAAARAHCSDDAPIVTARGPQLRCGDPLCAAARRSCTSNCRSRRSCAPRCASTTATFCAFCPGAAEIRRVQRALEESGLERARARSAAVRRTRRRGAGCGAGGRSRRAAQDRARHQHRRNQPDHRGRSRRRRLGTAPLRGIRSRDRHEPAGHRQGVAGRGGSAPRARRPPERRGSATGCGRRARMPRSRAQTPPEILHADLAPLALELACWGAVDAAQLALARSAARRAAGAGARPAAAARGHRCRRAHHGARPNARRSSACIRGSRTCWSRRASSARARLACDLAAILSERDILRAAAGRARCGLAPAGGGVARRRPGAARRRHAWMPAPSRRRSAAPAKWQRDFARGLPRLPRIRMRRPGILLALGLSGSHRPRARRRRPLPARQWPRRALRRSRRRSRNRSSSSRRNSTARSARRGFSWPRRLRAADLEQHFARADPRSRGDRLGRARAGGSRAPRAPARRLAARIRRRFAIPTRRPCRHAALAGLRQIGIAGAAVDQGAAPVAGARDVDARSTRYPRPTPWPDLSDAALARDSRGMGAAVDRRLHAPRAFRANGS